jgi:hypothetical protein
MREREKKVQMVYMMFIHQDENKQKRKERGNNSKKQ